MGVRRAVRVVERVQETPSTVTLRFDDPSPTRPGQFDMIWVPGADELPMSLSYVGERKGITVKAMGDTSRGILSIPEGASLGVRGPYGNAFDLSVKSVLVVAGGSGAAVLAPAAEAAIAKGAHVVVALGATTMAELLFRERFLSMGAHLHVATDDGTEGTHGFVTPLAHRLLQTTTFDAVWTCGPEVMMQKVLDSARRHGVPAFGSVERHMKCALGLCDACALGPVHVCVDGPVFPGATLESIDEFGRVKRDPSGRPVPA